MELIAPWWVYVLLFGYTCSTHHVMKWRKFPELARDRLFLQSIAVACVITGFALIVW